MKSGKFITFEGIDGAGKSTHVQFVANLFKAADHNIVTTREPGGTAVGEQLRDIVLADNKMHLETEALIMFASRREHLAQVIEPALARGDYVLSDRFTDSSFAFQCGGRKLPIEKMNALEQWVHPNLQPDLTFLFDVPTEVAQQRMSGSRVQDRFEKEKIEFHRDTRNEYLRRAAQFPERIRVIDATRTIAEIQVALEELCADAMKAWAEPKHFIAQP